MNLLVKRLTVYLLLISYSSIGLFGHAAAPDRLNFHNGDIQYAQGKEGPTAKQRPLWTKKRHFPPSVQTAVSVHSFDQHHLLLDTHRSTRVVPADCSIRHILFASRLTKPRDPPAVS
ncbi:MAG: hypothetical protein HUU02_05850 [Bacteroidetes bacterium]|nr:hypothetical protein [Bacteroidota bacterium]